MPIRTPGDLCSIEGRVEKPIERRWAAGQRWDGPGIAWKSCGDGYWADEYNLRRCGRFPRRVRRRIARRRCSQVGKRCSELRNDATIHVNVNKHHEFVPDKPAGLFTSHREPFPVNAIRRKPFKRENAPTDHPIQPNDNALNKSPFEEFIGLMLNPI
jgi:hypothetical protein